MAERIAPERTYRVGTFPGEKGRQPRAYLRTYNPAWEGCVEFEVIATSGERAKKAAIKLRQEWEAKNA